MLTDDITPGIPWTPPYYFVVLKVCKYDEKGVLPVIRHIGPAAALAYALYLDEINADVGTIREHVYDYYLQDAFGKDALDFCEERYYQYVEESETVEKVEA